jgi:hypothetical protein
MEDPLVWAFEAPGAIQDRMYKIVFVKDETKR